MTCLHLYLILVIISGCGNNSDLIRFRLTSILQPRIVLESKTFFFEINTYLCISEGPTIFKFQTKTRSFKHIFLLPTSILRVSQVPEKHHWYPQMSHLVLENSQLSSCLTSKIVAPTHQ